MRQLALHVDPLALRTIGSIDLKKEEPGLLQLAQRLDVPFHTWSAARLREYEQHFSGSAFVRQIAGVSSVSGPAAWLMSHGNILGDTLREQGVTITLGVTR